MAAGASRPPYRTSNARPYMLYIIVASMKIVLYSDEQCSPLRYNVCEANISRRLCRLYAHPLHYALHVVPRCFGGSKPPPYMLWRVVSAGASPRPTVSLRYALQGTYAECKKEPVRDARALPYPFGQGLFCKDDQ